MQDPYVYPKTDILKNKFDIKNSKYLNEMEAEYTSLRIREMLTHPVEGNFDFKHLCAIHKYIFQDIYDWAGKIRIMDIEKSEPSLGGLSIEYEDFDKIENMAGKILNKMNKRDWYHMSLNERAENFSKDMADLWKVHGFREGNTRTTVIFCCQFAGNKGIKLDRRLFEKNSAYVRTALVAASAKFSDLGDLSKPEFLINIVRDSMQLAHKDIVRGFPIDLEP